MKYSHAAALLLCPGLWSITIAAAAQAPAAATDWRVSLGAGVISAPRYIGADRQRTLALPAFDVRYGENFFFNPIDGAGFEQKLANGFSWSAALGADLNSRNAKDDSRFNGLQKIGPSAALKLKAEYEIARFNISATLSQRLASSDKAGISGELSAGYNFIANQQLLLSAGALTRVMDQKFADNFLSISPRQSRASGLGIYRAERGVLDNGVYAQAVYRIDGRWTVFSRIQTSRLDSNASNSPTVRKKDQTSALVFVNRTF